MPKQELSSEHTPAPVDDAARKRILQAIRTRKMWIAVLIVCLPFGIAEAMSHSAYFPLVAGGAMNLLLIYVAKKDIERLKRRLVPV